MTDPNAERSFSDEALARVKEAVIDAAWLTGRGYPADRVVEFVAEHHKLDAHQRRAMGQGACSEAQYRRRMAREMSAEDVERRPLAVDVASVLAIVEAALEGRPLLESIDGVLRDLHGATAPKATEEALQRVGATLKSVRPSRVRLYLAEDEATLASRIEDAAKRWKLKDVAVAKVPNVSEALKTVQNAVTSTGEVLDECPSWFNLSQLTIAGIDGTRRIKL